MRAVGLEPEDFEGDEPVEVWPENWPVFLLFCDLQTQWRVGFTGPYGLDYVAVHRELDLLELPLPERRAWMQDIRTLESGALEQIEAQRALTAPPTST